MSDTVRTKGHELVLRKLHGMHERQGAIQRELEEAGATTNPARIVELSRENGRLEKSLFLYRNFLKLNADAAEAMQISQDAAEDQEFRDLASAQLVELNQQIQPLLDQMLDEFLAGQRGTSDSMMLEIRAGTGGDEARYLPEISLRCIDDSAKKMAGVLMCSIFLRLNTEAFAN